MLLAIGFKAFAKLVYITKNRQYYFPHKTQPAFCLWLLVTSILTVPLVGFYLANSVELTLFYSFLALLRGYFFLPAYKNHNAPQRKFFLFWRSDTFSANLPDLKIDCENKKICRPDHLPACIYGGYLCCRT